ncbi:helicase [Erwinia sp. OLTSP20]|uniref:DEAD/DEAH box helicase n=1 Tax=unclassified Erwinia TaxID=2622719 RepID=UPI000C17734C|nr:MULTISPECIES: DEAD/DEAH box helicase [unclassified Erwinia]PIJ51008.1 helicase [Erwinia sp. OAMSP11]PIJ73724.1 helicase [Erwinia sp. OLSSP12]PIJ83081.1 helicase [Erwinia sp. OLCASP19]PIJ85679.1 helicase [Erwinia sp. OLMTSP26]PIJ87670.1 helicase [Erwinia sp. OLMDSP33]
MSSFSYDATQVRRWLGGRTVTKAQDLIPRVQNLQRQHNLLTGEIPGVGDEPWRVVVHFSRPQGKLHVSGECTCPVQTNCRHVAAVMLANLQQPVQQEASAPRPLHAEPVPALHLQSRSRFVSGYGRYGHRQKRLDFAALSFSYNGIMVDADSQETIFPDDRGQRWQLVRQTEKEQRWLAELQAAGLHGVPASHIYTPASSPLPGQLLVPEQPGDWRQIIRLLLPALRARGWLITLDDDFTWNRRDIEMISGRISRHEQGDFAIELTVSAGQRIIPLLPMLPALLAQDTRWLSGDLSTIANEEIIELRDADNTRLALAAAQLKPLLANLIDVLPDDGTQSHSLPLPRWDRGRLAALSQVGCWQADDEAARLALNGELLQVDKLPAITPPAGLQATLRDYQLQGVSWMQALSRQSLAGVLADDMGLGKTVQTLAHILLEKENARLDLPALIVVPTTLIYNWLSEAQRFAPELRVLSLSGPQRNEYFSCLDQYDVVLTSYSLLWRDQAVLRNQSWHLLILDEAQYVKNPHSQAGRAIRKLDARHRLCLTGTPLENHLGELWAQFDFLLPGFLGSEKDFLHQWRIPVERHGDHTRRQLLAQRVRPFMLRRRKQEVVAELPPKNSMVRRVLLEGAQRDLYETVRVALERQVRLALSRRQGHASSRILVLDALLKLRQICCDPRLVKLDNATSVRQSAKLTLLREMLLELLAEDRHVLIFSQFTEMLMLIAGELKKARIDYAMLTGSTRDRQAPVERFQRGEVPVFLISLKAGGVGLNLTAADTVIHYDPWWNPAAENQATDRAWRIGQQKTVFVYKLIVADSIEEKIVNLQQQKASLAESILQGSADETALFSDEELAGLLSS